MDKVSTGDVVVLKSGGPPMTVGVELSNDCFECQWFVEGESDVHEATFHVLSLKPLRRKRTPAKSAVP